MPAFLGLGPDNPIAWSNFHRKGGFRMFFGTAGAYFAILASLIFLSVRLNPRSTSGTYASWANGLLGLQFLFFIVIAAGRITATIRGDVSSGMIESLRMMPLAVRHAIVGYLSVAAATLGGFFIANFVLGLVANALAEMPAEHWLAANAILLVFAVFIWTIATFLAFLAKSAGGVLILISLVGVFGNAGLLYVAPGLVVLVGPLVGGTIFEPRAAQTEFAGPLAISIAAQFLVGAIFFAGAARKFRYPDSLALGPWLGLCLLVCMIGISLLAILQPESFQPRFLAWQFRNINSAVPFSGSTILAMFTALVPITSFARLHVAYQRGRVDDPNLRPTVPIPIIAGLFVTVILTAMIFALPNAPGAMRGLCIVAAFFGFTLSTLFIAAWFYRAVDNAKIIIAIWLFIYCLLPLGIDFARDRISDRDPDEPAIRMPSTFSPIGLLIESATQEEANLRPGAIFHVLIPLFPLTLYLRNSGRRPKPAKLLASL